MAHGLPLHPCAIPLKEHVQAGVNRMLIREQLSMGEEMAVRRGLVRAFLDAKPCVDECMAKYKAEQGETPEEDEEDYFSGDADDWDEEE